MLKPTLTHALATATRPLVGIWNSTGSSVAMEVLAAAGPDIVVIDGEHGPIELREILALLQASEPYPVTPLVRVPWNDEVRIKQVLDLGAQNLLIPMVSSGREALDAVAATRYPGRGRRGVGAMIARAARWGTVENYVDVADSSVSVTVQIETTDGVRNLHEILDTDGVDAVFVGPADLAAHMGYANNPSHPEVVSAVDYVVRNAVEAGVPVGLNAFAPHDADRVLDAGASFVVTSADVLLIAQGVRREVERLRERGEN